MKIPMPEQDAEKRTKNFLEVNTGYTEDDAIKEAERCLQCKNPTCVQGCPVNIDIPAFIKLIKEGKYDDALDKIKESNNLPGICGRVCPQERQCEKECVLSKTQKGISIGHLERFAADNANGTKGKRPKLNGMKIAVVGSGPAGLTCAADLAAKGYKVTVMEGLHEPGGVLRYGIPSFRLPKEIVVKEIENIRLLGVEIKENVVVGRTATIDELEKEYDAIFVGTGAGLPSFMGIEGENLNGVYSANEFLTRVNLMGANNFPDFITPVKAAKHVVVVGGGNTAMDAARVSRRLGSAVTIVYRRGFDEMPARKEEIRHAKEEGIKFLLLTNPVRIMGEREVEGIECIQMMLGPEDENKRKIPVRIENSEFVLACDMVIMAIGESPNPMISKTTDIMTNAKGAIIVRQNMQSSRKKVFAGGDIVPGEGTVIKAMGDGKKAAAAIDEMLNSDEAEDESN